MAKKIDLRTYLALEKAFVRRLQRSWRQQSAPLYQQITQHCINHQWDKARQLVPLLDMAEVGTENREWITYMLLSFAVFGAGTVSKKKPSFVGVGSFDTFLKQVTNNILMYLEYSGTAQVQREALQSIAEDEAKTKAIKFDPTQPRDEQGRWVDTESIRTERPMVLAKGAQAIIGHYAAGRMPLDADKVSAIEKVIQSGKTLPPLVLSPEGILKDGHHRLQAYRNRGVKVVRVVDESLKWDESKHPRDKEGQFASSAGFTAEERARLANPPPIEGGYGPVRAEWEKRNKASMEAFDVFMDAKAAHRVNVNKAHLRMEQLAEEHPDETVEALEARVYSDPEYIATRDALRAADRAMKEADDARARIEPTMRKEVVTNLANDVAEKMGIDPKVIRVVDKDPPSFQVGTKSFTEAGHYDPATRQIEINSRNLSYGDAPGVKGVVAHEISHLIYHTLKREADREFQQYIAKAVTPDGSKHSDWYHERFEKVPGMETWRRLKPEYREEFARDYPAATVLGLLAEGEPFTGIAQSMVDENGHSEYAKSYWTPEARAARGHTYESAINESIAEVTRFITHPRGWYEKTKPSSDSPWLKLTKSMHEWYAERQDKIEAERKQLVEQQNKTLKELEKRWSEEEANA